MPRVTEVRKRDSRIVPFDQTKISDAIYKAIRSVGGGDRSLADDLAAAVTLFLEKKFAGEIPHIEDIQDMVETVLRETNHDKIAQAYIEYRKKRTKIREILHVHKTTQQGPEVETGYEQISTPWSKANIVAALVKEADIDVALAEDIASHVEEKIFNSGIRRISTSLIRELVDNELFERGFAAKLKRQAPISFPKYNLEQVLFSVDAKEPYSFAKDPEDIDQLVSRHILRQYSLETIYSAEVSDAIKAGKIFVHRLGEPLRPYRIILSDAHPLTPTDHIPTGLLRLLRSAGEELCIPFPGKEEVLLDLGLLACSGRAITLVASGGQKILPPPEAGSLASCLNYMIYIDPDARFPEALLETAAGYFTRGFKVSFHVGVPPTEGLLPAKVSLNLPQLACRAGRTRLGDIFGEIDQAFSLAVKSLLERKSFTARAAHTSDLPLWELIHQSEESFDLNAATFLVGVFGIVDAAKYITGKELFEDQETFQFAERLLHHLSEKTAQESKGMGIRIVLEETCTPHILAEQTQRDQQMFPELKEIFRGRPGPARYSPGARLPAQAPLDPITRHQYLARLFPYLQIDDIVNCHSELKSEGKDLLISLLEESIPLFSKNREAAPASGF